MVLDYEESNLFWLIERVYIERDRVYKQIQDRVYLRIEPPQLREELEAIYKQITYLQELYNDKYQKSFRRPYEQEDNR